MVFGLPIGLTAFSGKAIGLIVDGGQGLLDVVEALGEQGVGGGVEVEFFEALAGALEGGS